MDPNKDRLLKFEGDETTSLGFLWIFMLVVLYAVYSMISRQSGGIQRSVLTARRLAYEATKSAGGHDNGGGKNRSD